MSKFKKKKTQWLEQENNHPQQLEDMLAYAHSSSRVSVFPALLTNVHKGILFHDMHIQAKLSNWILEWY